MKKIWASTMSFLALSAVLVACPQPKTTIKVDGSILPAATRVAMCVPLGLQVKITDLKNQSLSDLSFVVDFGDGSGEKTFKIDQFDHTYIRGGTYTVKGKVMLKNQNEPALEGSFTVQVDTAADCAYIVELQAPATGRLSTQKIRALSNQIIGETGGEELATFDTLLQGYAARYSPDEINTVKTRPEIQRASISSIGGVDAVQSLPTDMWGLDQADGVRDSQYQFTTTGRGVDMYIMDTGVRPTHQEFGSRVQKGYNVYTKDDATDDLNGHGTHVAAIAAGSSVGIARNARIIPVKIFDGASGNNDEWAYIKGFDWIVANHDPSRVGVINLSAGMNQESLEQSVLDKVVQEFIKRNPNLLLVMAAGNKGKDACKFSPAKNAKLDSAFPVVSVGASDSNNARAGISNNGDCVDIYAPGVGIRSASNSSDRDYRADSGTSMASPFVAGAAAAYLESNRNAKPNEVKAALINSSLKGLLGNGATPNRLLVVDRPLAISVTPDRATIGLLESQTFNAIVEGSSNTAVDWEFSTSGGTQSGNSFTFVAGRTPGTYTLIAISKADPTKRFTVQITVTGGVLFKTDPTTMRSGNTQTLEAEVIGLSDPNVTWSVTPETAGILKNPSGAKIDFAPTDPGTYTLRVSSAADPSKTSSKQIRVDPAIVVNVSPDTIPIQVNQGQVLTATVSNTTNGRVTWDYTPKTNSSLQVSNNTATFVASATGVYSITATSVEDPSKSDTSIITVTAAPVIAVTVSPTSETMQTNIQKNFNATVQNSSNTAVTWAVAPTANANLSQTGNVASFSASVAGEYTLTATSVADPSKSAIATVTVTNPPASVNVTISPSTTTIFTNTNQVLTPTVSNTSNTAVVWTVLPTTNATLTPSGSDNSATFSASVAGVYNVTATSSADPSKSFTSVITVTDPPPIIVQVSPSSNTIFTNTDQGITATVQNATNSSVTWSVVPTTNATLTSNGNTVTFRATLAGTYTVTATSNQNSNFKASSTITVNNAPPVSVSLNSSSVTLMLGATQQFSATVTNAANTNVTWNSNNNAVASVSSTGLVTANTVGAATITATSVADPSKSASASIIARDAVRVTPTSASLQINASQVFNADVFGLASSNVSWTVSPTAGVSLTSGSTSATFSSSQAGTYSLTATSTADSSKAATVSITVLPNVSISITQGSSISVNAGVSINLNAVVTGAADTSVTWRYYSAGTQPTDGITMTTSGNTATITGNYAVSYTVEAKSNANPTRIALINVSCG